VVAGIALFFCARSAQVQGHVSSRCVLFVLVQSPHCYRSTLALGRPELESKVQRNTVSSRSLHFVGVQGPLFSVRPGRLTTLTFQPSSLLLSSFPKLYFLRVLRLLTVFSSRRMKSACRALKFSNKLYIYIYYINIHF